MKNIFSRLIAVCLVTCLVVDPVTARAFHVQLPAQSSARVGYAERLRCEAMTLPLVANGLNLDRHATSRTDRVAGALKVAAGTAVGLGTILLSSVRAAAQTVSPAAIANTAGNIYQKTADYTISWGDTLTGIAQHFNVSLRTLLSLNPKIINQNIIGAGNILHVPAQYLLSADFGISREAAGQLVANMPHLTSTPTFLETLPHSTPTIDISLWSLIPHTPEFWFSFAAVTLATTAFSYFFGKRFLGWLNAEPKPRFAKGELPQLREPVPERYWVFERWPDLRFTLPVVLASAITCTIIWTVMHPAMMPFVVGGFISTSGAAVYKKRQYVLNPHLLYKKFMEKIDDWIHYDRYKELRPENFVDHADYRRAVRMRLATDAAKTLTIKPEKILRANVKFVDGTEELPPPVVEIIRKAQIRPVPPPRSALEKCRDSVVQKKEAEAFSLAARTAPLRIRNYKVLTDEEGPELLVFKKRAAQTITQAQSQSLNVLFKDIAEAYGQAESGQSPATFRRYVDFKNRFEAIVGTNRMGALTGAAALALQPLTDFGELVAKTSKMNWFQLPLLLNTLKLLQQIHPRQYTPEREAQWQAQANNLFNQAQPLMHPLVRQAIQARFYSKEIYPSILNSLNWDIGTVLDVTPRLAALNDAVQQATYHAITQTTREHLQAEADTLRAEVNTLDEVNYPDVKHNLKVYLDEIQTRINPSLQPEKNKTTDVDTGNRLPAFMRPLKPARQPAFQPAIAAFAVLSSPFRWVRTTLQTIAPMILIFILSAGLSRAEPHLQQTVPPPVQGTTTTAPPVDAQQIPVPPLPPQITSTPIGVDVPLTKKRPGKNYGQYEYEYERKLTDDFRPADISHLPETIELKITLQDLKKPPQNFYIHVITPANVDQVVNVKIDAAGEPSFDTEVLPVFMNMNVPHIPLPDIKVLFKASLLAPDTVIRITIDTPVAIRLDWSSPSQTSWAASGVLIVATLVGGLFRKTFDRALEVRVITAEGELHKSESGFSKNRLSIVLLGAFASAGCTAVLPNFQDFPSALSVLLPALAMPYLALAFIAKPQRGGRYFSLAVLSLLVPALTLLHGNPAWWPEVVSLVVVQISMTFFATLFIGHFDARDSIFLRSIMQILTAALLLVSGSYVQSKIYPERMIALLPPPAIVSVISEKSVETAPAQNENTVAPIPTSPSMPALAPPSVQPAVPSVNVPLPPLPSISILLGQKVSSVDPTARARESSERVFEFQPMDLSEIPFLVVNAQRGKGQSVPYMRFEWVRKGETAGTPVTTLRELADTQYTIDLRHNTEIKTGSLRAVVEGDGARDNLVVFLRKFTLVPEIASARSKIAWLAIGLFTWIGVLANAAIPVVRTKLYRSALATAA